MEKEIIRIRGHHLPPIAEYFYLRKRGFIPEAYFVYRIANIKDARKYGEEFNEKITDFFEKLYRRNSYEVEMAAGSLDSICDLDCPLKREKCIKGKRADKINILFAGLKENQLLKADEFKKIVSLKYWKLRFVAIYLRFLYDF